MEKIRTYKQMAKASLQNKWGDAAILTLVYVGIAYVVSGAFVLPIRFLSFNPCLGLIPTIFLLPLAWGYAASFLATVRGENVKIDHLWDGYRSENIIRVFSTFLVATLIYIAVIAIFILIISIISVMVAFISVDVMMGGAIIILSILCGFIYVYILLRWAMVYFILRDEPQLKNTAVLKASARMMKGHKWQFLKLYLSFIGWMFVGIITLGVGMLWVAPYLTTASAHFYEDLKKEPIYEQ